MVTQKIFNKVCKASKLYGLLEPQDKVAVGLSGGKDSFVLLNALVKYRDFLAPELELLALVLDLGFDNHSELLQLGELCRDLNVNFRLEQTEIAKVVFEIRKEKNPCSLCAKMRRGALHSAAKQLGCNKVALGHHMDDVIETFMLNLFNEGRIGTFSPKAYLSRRDLHVIRPLVYVEEKDVMSEATRLGYKPVCNPCPSDKTSARAKMKEKLAELERKDKGVKERIFGAICRSGVSGFKA